MIAGETIRLTELRRSDYERLFRWINDPETVRYNAPYAPVHEASHEAWFETVASDPSRIVFGIRPQGEDRLAGVIQLVGLHPVNRSAELIIRIGDEVDRGRGFGGEAVRLATAFGFADRNLQRIWLSVFEGNDRAIRAYEMAGFVQEGVMRRAVFIGGTWRNVVIMARLSDDAP